MIGGFTKYVIPAKQGAKKCEGNKNNGV